MGADLFSECNQGLALLNVTVTELLCRTAIDGVTNTDSLEFSTKNILPVTWISYIA
jgi:hypothetical protein